MSAARIRLAMPVMGEEELIEIGEVLRSGYVAQGPTVARFEREVAGYVGAAHGFAVSSATTALHLSLVVLGIGPGDEVLVPDFTFPATANVVVQQGATPVLVDIDAQTFTMDVQDLERKVTSRSRAVIPVHTFGLAADMDGVHAVAERHGLVVVEDAACALGATYRGRRCGTLGKLACFSFHARKVISTGEGGLITTDDDGLAERIQLLRSHGGRREGGRFSFMDAGFNYRLSDIQAAVGLAQMRRLDGFLRTRRELADALSAALRDLPGVLTPFEPAWGRHSYQTYVVLLPGEADRDEVIRLMAESEIETTIGTYALHEQPFFQDKYGYHSGQLPISSRAFRSSLALPLHPALDPGDIKRIRDALGRALRSVAAPTLS